MIGVGAAVGAAAVGAGILAVRTRRYRGLLAIDPASDQPPGFDAGALQAVPIELSPAGFVWPNVEPEVGATIVLEAVLRSTLRGRWMDPCLEANGSLSVRRSYVERGVRGVRYLSLGAGPLAKPGEAVALNGRGLCWQPGPARLWVAPALDVRSGATLVVAPHSDDAELAAFGLGGADSWIVTVSAGEVGTFAMPGYSRGSREEAWARVERRTADSLAAADAAGVSPERVLMLGYPDGRLQEMRREPEREQASQVLAGRTVDDCRALHRSGLLLPNARPTWSCLVEDCRRILRHVQPRRIVVPHPTLDLHGDHVAAFFAIAEAMLAEGLRGCDLLCYANHRFGARSGNNPQPLGARDGCAPLPWSPMPGPHYAFPVSVPLGEATANRKRAALAGMCDIAPAPRHRVGVVGALRTVAGRTF
ncbi:MAG: hypothetical protein RL398_3589, partial [Planctomycetota bacterium]